MIHNSKFKGSLKFIYEEMKKRDKEFEFIVISKKQLFSVSGKGIKKVLSLCKAGFYFYVIWNYHLATAEYIFLNDNFQPLAYMNVSKKAKIVQVWHGVGAFKRFGLSTETDLLVRHCTSKGNQKLTHLFVSSKQVIPYYAEAMGIDESKIFPDGIPVTDYYFDEKKKKKARENIYKKYPELVEKKILLYTPTFRKSEEENKTLLEHFDYKEIKSQLGEDWVIFIRLHPQINRQVKITGNGCYNVTEYADIKELFTVADVLINDYSSTVVEYALLRKPIILYAYDLEQYDRGFYRDYREHAPGAIAYNQKELIVLLKQVCLEDKAYLESKQCLKNSSENKECLEENGCLEKEKLEHFLQIQYDKMDGKATKRVVDRVLGKRN